MRKKSYVTVTDQFCGAGGSSIGVVAAGAELALGLNHWPMAIQTHASNFPQAAHDCTDISACNPRRYPRTDVLITAPECTNHTVAKGKKRPSAQTSFLENGQPDPAAERSRATMWDVPRFAEVHDYDLIITENVADVRHWVLWDAWIHAMNLLGYAHQCVYLNSMFCHPTPQSRDRIYIVFWKRGNRKPDLDIRPSAWCPACGCDVQSVQSWKDARKPWGKYRTQYVYRCPVCAQVVTPYYHAAANAIDWSLPAPIIRDRARPLSDNTMRRIRVGLERFGRQTPLVMDTSRTHSESNRCRDVFDTPMPTQTASPSASLVIPPFLVGNYSPGWVRTLDQPTGTITATDHHALCVPPFLLSYYTKDTGTDIHDPVPTVTTLDRHALVTPPAAFILSYYQRHGDMASTPMTAAMPTQPTWALHHLITTDQAIEPEDCGYRILQPHEIGRAMAFPDEYVVLGSQRDKIRQYGNAVTPPVMTELFKRCVATLG